MGVIYAGGHTRGRERWRTSPDDPPVLWVIAAGRPDGALTALGMVPLPGWPTGVYVSAPALRMRVVVIPELPVTRDTLLVRLMGKGRALRAAMEQLKRLPLDAPERSVAMPVLVVLHDALPEAAYRTDDEQELAMTTMELYENWRQRTRAEGKAEGEFAMVVRQFERRLGRPLSDGERTTLRLRMETLGSARLGDLVLDLDVAALSDWLTDPAAT